MDFLMKIANVIISIGNFLWGVPMLTLLGLLGIILTVGTKGFQFRRFGHIWKNTLGTGNRKQGESQKGISSFKAACMALCNTLGTGNIAGVALAIAMGGPGAMFWIWIAMLLGMIIKYGEITMAAKFHELDSDTGLYRGGIMWYIRKGLDKKWHWLASVFCFVYVIVVINAPAVQINTICSSVTGYFDVPSMLVGGILVVAMIIVGYGGLKKVSDFAGNIIPVMAGSYFLVCIIVIVMNIGKLPETFGLIFKYAFSDIKAMAGGFGGATVALAIRHGLCRGFYSSGAGSGDATFAHSSADVKHPVQQGMWGITEVFIDGIVLTCTGLVVLTTGVWESGVSGAPLVAEAIGSAFHSSAFGNIFVIACILLFAFTSAFMCLYYSEVCLKWVTNNNVIKWIYRFVICGWAFFCTNELFVQKVSIIWSIGDFGSVCVMICACFAVFLLRKEIFKTTADYEEYYEMTTEEAEK